MQSKSGTLTANTVATVTLTLDGSGNFELEVLSRDGAAEINFTHDGTDPTVGGQNTYVVPAAIGALKLQIGGVDTLVVKLISSGIPKYTVTVT